MCFYNENRPRQKEQEILANKQDEEGLRFCLYILKYYFAKCIHHCHAFLSTFLDTFSSVNVCCNVCGLNVNLSIFFINFLDSRDV